MLVLFDCDLIVELSILFWKKNILELFFELFLESPPPNSLLIFKLKERLSSEVKLFSLSNFLLSGNNCSLFIIFIFFFLKNTLSFIEFISLFILLFFSK